MAVDFHLAGTLVLVALALVAGSYLHTAFRRGLRSLPGPLAARFTSLYRISLVRDGRAVPNYRRLHERYGKVVRTGPNHVAILDPQLISTIYGTSSKYRKSGFYSTTVPTYEGEPLDNMFTAVDPALHRRLRSPTVQVYSMTNLRGYEQHVDDCTAIFFDILSEKQGRPFDYTEYFQWYAFDVITSISYNRRFGFLDRREDVDKMCATMSSLAPYVAVIGQVPHLHPYLYGNRHLVNLMLKLFPDAPDPLGSLFNDIDRELQTYDAEEKQLDRQDFLAQLRAKDNPERVHHKRDLMNHLSNNILAGSDTTAVALRAIFYYVIKNPRVCDKLVAEIDSADQKGALSPFITYDQAQNLEYLQVVIKEALRFHPPLCFPLERVVPPEGARIHDFNIPGGTVVGMMAPLLNRDKDIFGEDADTFRPERWLEASEEHLKVMERGYATFGHGARACIGKNIAMLEITKFVPEVFRRFDVAWASDKPEWRVYSEWFYKQSGMILKFTPRGQIKA